MIGFSGLQIRLRTQVSLICVNNVIMPRQLKFIHSEKTTKFEQISLSVLTLLFLRSSLKVSRSGNKIVSQKRNELNLFFYPDNLEILESWILISSFKYLRVVRPSQDRKSNSFVCFVRIYGSTIFFSRSTLVTGMQQGEGQGGAAAPPDFGRSVNPISTKGGWLCPPQYYLPPRIFDPCCIPVLEWWNTTIFFLQHLTTFFLSAWGRNCKNMQV
jgi:hypothetical protein